uniref:Retroviral polymerase SH3-like domain-containing protein n=1 Tax=Lactuca sativa TaxID=4236 RepID=A0A9R1W1B6_LACSA|nr:hypothetical protein LSAT_V11C400157480 [Lactuca sativa]
MNNRKPNVKFFHIFGCRYYIKNNRDQLGKFVPKAYEGIFLGYCLYAATYKVLNKRTRVIEESSDVTFDESYVRVLDPNHFAHKKASPDVSQPHQPSKDSSSTKAQVEGEPSLNDYIPKSPLESSELSTPTSHHQYGPVITPIIASFKEEPPLDGSIFKGTLKSSQPSSPWFQREPHSTGSIPSSSFTSTPSAEFKHATVEGEPPISGSSRRFQDDIFEGTFTSDYPPRPREQYETVYTP